MNAPKVILINRMLGYGGLNTALKGQSGKAYGQPSRYSPEYKCHIVELSLSEYEAAREDIFKKMRGAMSGFMLWEPQFIAAEFESTAVPDQVREFAKGYEIGASGSGLPEDSDSSFKAGFYTAKFGHAPWSYGAGEPDASVGQEGTPCEGKNTETKPKWNDLVKSAKVAGVKIKKGGSREDLLRAIQDHQAAKQSHAAAA